MNKIIKFFQKGTVIILITVPFLFCSGTMGQELLRLKLSDYKIASLTSFVRKLDTLKTDSNITTAKQKEPLKKFRMRKSPTVAVLLSAALPGAGQFYNESYWKIPVIGGLIGYFGYEYFRLNNLYKDYRDEYSVSQTPENPNGNLSLKSLREFYRGQRDDFVWYFVIVYVVNLVDAYVDAHLFDFDVSDEKFLRSGINDKEYRLKMNLKF
ncbi:MAG: hypothetical protein UZ05_CHB002002377 [Chlorobi bacterium OLB5]|nr:MAG: hypothetical protein UZ05_CHB002002377 [Chlorobi bacterium OLB5]